MARSVEPRGKYVILNETFLQKKAGYLNDPRHVFYKAMLATRSYSVYLDAVGDKQVDAVTYKTRLVSGRMEILYARRKRWIRDV